MAALALAWLLFANWLSCTVAPLTRIAGPGRGATFKLRVPVLVINSVTGSKTAARGLTLTRASGTGGLSIECPPRLDGVRVLVVDNARLRFTK